MGDEQIKRPSAVSSVGVRATDGWQRTSYRMHNKVNAKSDNGIRGVIKAIIDCGWNASQDKTTKLVESEKESRFSTSKYTIRVC